MYHSSIFPVRFGISLSIKNKTTRSLFNDEIRGTNTTWKFVTTPARHFISFATIHSLPILPLVSTSLVFTLLYTVSWSLTPIRRQWRQRLRFLSFLGHQYTDRAWCLAYKKWYIQDILLNGKIFVISAQFLILLKYQINF